MDSWLLRWRTGRDERPQFLLPAGRRSPAPEHGLYSARDPDGAVCVFDGYLFEVDPATDPARWVLDLHQRQRAAVPGDLRGSFSFALWDERERELTICRDTIGAHPLFYSWSDRLLTASPSMRILRQQPEVSGEINAQLIAEMLLARFNDHQTRETYFRDIGRVPPSHSLVSRGGAPEIERYWDPLPPRFEWASREELASLPERLETAVARCLAAGVDSLALSGGFDSVSLAILLAELRDDRPPVHALSLHVTEAAMDESATQRAVAEALGMPQTMLTLEECLDGVPLMSDALRRSAASPGPVMSPWQSAYTTLLEAGRSKGLGKLMSGNGGDETLYVDGAYGADCLARGRLGDLWRFLRVSQRTSPSSPYQVAQSVLWNRSAKPLLIESAEALAKRLGPGAKASYRSIRQAHWQRRSPWIDPSRLEPIAAREQQPSFDGEAKERRYRRKLRRAAHHPLHMFAMDQGSTWAYSLGYQCFFPYWDRDLSGLLWRTHPERLIEGGRFKGILRRLVEERLERVSLPRRKVDFTEGAASLLREIGPPAWANLEGNLELARLGIVEGDALRAFMRGFFEARVHDVPTAYEVLFTEHWLQVQGTDVTTARPMSVLASS